MKKSQKTKKPEKYKKIKIMFGYIKILLLLVIIFWIISYFSSFLIETFNPEFDPKIHTCDEWCKCLCDCSSVSISYNENTDELFLDNCCSKDSSGAWQQQTCTLWHDTTFCEMCQEIPLEEWEHRLIYDNQKVVKHYKTCHDNCLCDEKTETAYSGYIKFCAQKTCYKKYFLNINKTDLDKYRKMLTDNDFTVSINNKTTSFEINYFISTYLKCISVREKTKCEKDNPDYIYIDTECTFQECLKFNKTISYEINDKIFFVKICRKKTIDDYSCDELKQHIWFEDTYCNSKQEWNTKCFDKLYVKDIKKIYIEKGCEI